MLARTCAVITLTLGMAGLTRWVAGRPEYLLTPWWPLTTAPMAGVLLTLAGLSLLVLSGRTLAQVRLASRGYGGRGLLAVSSVLMGCGLWRLLEIGLERDLGFDRLSLLAPYWTPETAKYGSMSFPTAACVVILGGSIALGSRWLVSPRPRVVAGWLGASCGAIAGVFLLGHLYGQPLTYGGRPLAMAANTAMALCTGGAAMAAIVSRHDRLIRRRLIDSLRRTRESLEARVRERTGALQDALAALRHETEERRKSEASLIHAQKMESIGRLAAGIAHDFNNLLMVIRTSAELAERQSGPATLSLLRQIRDASQSGTALTARLLAFARKAPAAELTAVPAAPLVREVVSLVRPMLGSGITARVVAEPELWPVHADPGQIEQVLVNLCINAKDAMPSGGTLTVLAANTAVAEPMPATPEVVPPGDYVVVEVKDTGVGMTREIIAHAFEPFFTTKPEGRGSGLGLATSYGIVRQHGGRITVESQPGVGTQFRIFLPRAMPAA